MTPSGHGPGFRIGLRPSGMTAEGWASAFPFPSFRGAVGEPGIQESLAADPNVDNAVRPRGWIPDRPAAIRNDGTSTAALHPPTSFRGRAAEPGIQEGPAADPDTGEVIWPGAWGLDSGFRCAGPECRHPRARGPANIIPVVWALQANANSSRGATGPRSGLTGHAARPGRGAAFLARQQAPQRHERRRAPLRDLDRDLRDPHDGAARRVRLEP